MKAINLILKSLVATLHKQPHVFISIFELPPVAIKSFLTFADIELIQFNRIGHCREAGVFWVGLVVGIFMGANIGIVVAGFIIAKEHGAASHDDETPIDSAVEEDFVDIQGELPPIPKSGTYLDKYPYA
jgi:hypothetical protein